MNLKDVSIFAFGFLLATPIFMTCIIIIGNLAGIIMPEIIIKTLNAAMGFILIYLGVKNIFLRN
ncbi:MAG: hypothetical protein LBS81_03870 [Endomicrobium sp.]|jgi:threonine/homoserine/homoserine lactone efflux protein|nr:hypothetical protein [Endomicrobium sp.]